MCVVLLHFSKYYINATIPYKYYKVLWSYSVLKSAAYHINWTRLGCLKWALCEVEPDRSETGERESTAITRDNYTSFSF